MNSTKRTGPKLWLPAFIISCAILSTTATSAGIVSLGDVNFDGTVDHTDALMIIQKVVGRETTAFPDEVGDVDCNGVVSVGDAIMVSRFFAGMQDEFQCAFSSLEVDDRDRQAYPMVVIGNQTWMAKNMNIDIPESESDVCYNNNPNNCNIYGRLYDRDNAQNVCPAGWHLPKEMEWDLLLDYVENSKKLQSVTGWSNDGNGSDSYGFAALPGGMWHNAFSGLGTRGSWWTASQTNDLYRYVELEPDFAGSDGTAMADDAMSVRCIKDTRTDDTRKALVIVVDNSKSMEDSQFNMLYQASPTRVGRILADMYGVEYSELQGMTLTQIVEAYGEDWVIEDLESKANGHYDDYISLTDSDATLANFLDAVDDFNAQGYVVDVVMNLHGSASGDILFYDGSYPTADVTSQILSDNLNVSVVYQTMCYGSDMTSDWENIGIYAVNGSIGQNMFVNFAPGAFLEHWIGGMSYEEAVIQARLDDLNEIKTKVSDAGLGIALMFYPIDNESRQTVAGLYPETSW